MAKSDKRLFNLKQFFWHDTSSCTCPIYLYCLCKVSETFIKSSGTIDFPVYALSKHKQNLYLQKWLP